MKNQNKNKYFLFLFSLLPGAAEMYMGLMHLGTSLMALFFASFMLIAFIREDILIAVPILLWFYGFFHARNLATCDEVTFDGVRDIYVWDEFFGEGVFRTTPAMPRKWLATALILGGIIMFFHSFSTIALNVLSECFHWGRSWIFNLVLHTTPRIILSLLLIALGVKLIRGKKIELDKAAETGDASAVPIALPHGDKEDEHE